MKKRYFIWYLISAVFLLFISQICLAGEIKSLPEFTKEDHVLIIAPHPDDETIGAGGVIQRALRMGAKVKVICFTNGEHNELSFILYKKRIIFKRRGFINMGQVRAKETISAMENLGLEAKDIVFLGYPDFCLMDILSAYWDKEKPYKSLLTRIKAVPYPECLSFKAPYIGQSILNDLEKVIYDFKSNKIFLTGPADRNGDHRTVYVFLNIALWDLEDKMPNPQLFPFIVHEIGWPVPRGYHPELTLEPPPGLKDSDISWRALNLTDEEIKAKNDTISLYKSQVKCNPPYLFTFARKNELFGDYHMIKLIDRKTESIQWHNVSPLNAENEKSSALEYAKKENSLFIKILAKRRIKPIIYLFGYNRKTNFAEMPKIEIRAGRRGLRILDKKKNIEINDVQMQYQNKTFILKIPLSGLGNPDHIFAYVKAGAKDLSLDQMSWRILDLKEEDTNN